MKASELIGWEKGVLVKQEEWKEFAEIMLKEKPYEWSSGESLIDHSEFGIVEESELVHYLSPVETILYSTVEESKLDGVAVISFCEFKEKLQEVKKNDNRIKIERRG